MVCGPRLAENADHVWCVRVKVHHLNNRKEPGFAAPTCSGRLLFLRVAGIYVAFRFSQGLPSSQGHLDLAAAGDSARQLTA